MRFAIIIGICLFLVLPLASALTYDSITNSGILQDYDAENIYLVSPETIYFGEEFSITIGIEINTSLSKNRTFFLDGFSDEPVVMGVDTPQGRTFAIYQWNITPWNNQNLVLRAMMDDINIFEKKMFLNLEEKNVINSTILSSKIIDLNSTDKLINAEARVALAEQNIQYSPLEFDQMVKLAKKQHDLIKRVDNILEVYEDNTSMTKTVITISVSSKKGYENSGVDIIEIIPKEMVSDAKMIKSSPLAYVVKEDPVIMWHVTDIQSDLSYEIKSNVKATGNTVMISRLTATDKQERKFPWKIIGPLLVIPLIAGLIVFFARFEPKTKK